MRDSASRIGDQDLAVFGRDNGAADQEADRQRQAGNHKQRVACGLSLHVEAEDVLEIGKPIVAAEAKVISEEAEHQREGHRLGDDREIDAGNAAAEREPAEHKGEQARRQHHHQCRRRRTN